jgi:hypothetical protein
VTRSKKNQIAANTLQPKAKLTKLVQAIRSISKPKPQLRKQQIKFESLEPRLLLSADPLTAALAAPFDSDWSQQAETIELDYDVFSEFGPAVNRPQSPSGDYFDSEGRIGETLVLGRSLDELVSDSDSDNWIVGDNAAQVEQHIVFVDSRVDGYESLLDSVLPVAENKDGPVPVIEVVILDADRDGVEQISEYLADQQGVFAVHIPCARRGRQPLSRFGYS